MATLSELIGQTILHYDVLEKLVGSEERSSTHFFKKVCGHRGGMMVFTGDDTELDPCVPSPVSSHCCAG